MKKNKNNLWKSKKLKNSPENSPKWPENIQNDPQKANFEKNQFFKNVWQSRKKTKIWRKIHKNGQNDPKIIPKMFKLPPKMQILKKIKIIKNFWKSRKKSKIHPKMQTFLIFKLFYFHIFFSNLAITFIPLKIGLQTSSISQNDRQSLLCWVV